MHVHHDGSRIGAQRVKLTIIAWGMKSEVEPLFGTYADGTTAVMLYEEHEMYCRLTVSVPGTHLNEGEILIKDWAENEPVIQHLLSSGHLLSTGREVASGHVFPKVMRLGPEFLAAKQEQEAS